MSSAARRATMKSACIASLAVMLALASCSSSSPSPHRHAPTPAAPDDAERTTAQPDVEIAVVRSALERNTTPSLSSSELSTLVSSQADFAVDLYQAVRKQSDYADKDLFLSPHSVSIALAMTYAGARGETAGEMKKALHFDLPDERLHTAFDYLDLQLESRGKDAKGKDGEPFRLNVTNSIWGQKGMKLETPFLDNLAVNYGAGLNVVDFIRATEKSRATINAWVEDETEKRIKDILPAGIVTQDTRLVLVNAVYFNAAWASVFDPGATKEAPFTKVDGSTVQVPMMNRSTSRPYVKGDGYEAVEMPYDGNELSMLVIAPTAGSFGAFESSLTGSKLISILDALETKEVSLAFPKLKLEGAFSLQRSLASLGMESAFTSRADFSGITTAERLAVTDVLHKTFLELDERGTEAAAATAVVFERMSAPAEPVVMSVDRPFLLGIVDRQTKTFVFLGRILEPKL